MAPCGSVNRRGVYANVHPPTFYIMKTIIFDIDGTLTDMWPIEKSVLLTMLGKEAGSEIEKLYLSGVKDTYSIFCIVSKRKIGKSNYRIIYNKKFSFLENKDQLPLPEKYPLVDLIKKNKPLYRFVYATGGQAKETRYVLKCLKLDSIFDFKNSLDKSNYRFSKSTGLPFNKIKATFSDCLLISDSQNDCNGAIKAGVPFIKIKPRQILSNFLPPLAKSRKRTKL